MRDQWCIAFLTQRSICFFIHGFAAIAFSYFSCEKQAAGGIVCLAGGAALGQPTCL